MVNHRNAVSHRITFHNSLLSCISELKTHGESDEQNDEYRENRRIQRFREII